MLFYTGICFLGIWKNRTSNLRSAIKTQNHLHNPLFFYFFKSITAVPCSEAAFIKSFSTKRANFPLNLVTINPSLFISILSFETLISYPLINSLALEPSKSLDTSSFSDLISNSPSILEGDISTSSSYWIVLGCSLSITSKGTKSLLGLAI